MIRWLDRLCGFAAGVLLVVLLALLTKALQITPPGWSAALDLVQTIAIVCTAYFAVITFRTSMQIRDREIANRQHLAALHLSYPITELATVLEQMNKILNQVQSSPELGLHGATNDKYLVAVRRLVAQGPDALVSRIDECCKLHASGLGEAERILVMRALHWSRIAQRSVSDKENDEPCDLVILIQSEWRVQTVWGAFHWAAKASKAMARLADPGQIPHDLNAPIPVVYKTDTKVG